MIPHLIYQGTVRHRRHYDKAHEFRYRISAFCFDISKIAESFAPYQSISVEKFNWLSYYRKHYLTPSPLTLDEAARALVATSLGTVPKGKIYLLTQLACLGYCFNPISIYFIFKENSEILETLIIEVTNTPWQEKHCYVQQVTAVGKHKHIYQCHFKKELHVSPFLSMQYDYQFNIKMTEHDIHVHMVNLRNDERHFDATLTLTKVTAAHHGIQRVPWRQPWMTYKITAAIYWQALKLWWKGVRFYAHPVK